MTCGVKGSLTFKTLHVSSILSHFLLLSPSITVRQETHTTRHCMHLQFSEDRKKRHTKCVSTWNTSCQVVSIFPSTGSVVYISKGVYTNTLIMEMHVMCLSCSRVHSCSLKKNVLTSRHSTMYGKIRAFHFIFPPSRDCRTTKNRERTLATN